MNSPGAGDVGRGLQVGHDRLRGALGDGGGALMSRIRASGLRAISSSTCPWPVSSVHEPPRSPGIPCTEHVSREKTHVIFNVFLLTGNRREGDAGIPRSCRGGTAVTALPGRVTALPGSREAS